MSWQRTLWLAAALILLTSCTPSQQVNPSPTPTRAPFPTATPTATPPPLGQMPAHCPVTDAHSQAKFAELAPVLGATPAWATWSPGPAVFHGTPEEYVSPYGWAMTKSVWEVGPSYASTVSVRGEDIFDYTPLLFQFGDNTPTANVVLDPLHPDHPVSVVGPDWREWGLYIMPPKAGCYIMQISWPTGHWSVIFAFGT